MTEPERLLIYEWTRETGELERMWLCDAGAALELISGSAPAAAVLALPANAVDIVMRRYGKPLAEDLDPAEPEFRLQSGARLARFRHLARFDVIARDYLVYRSSETEALAALAAPIAAALRHLAERCTQRSSNPPR
jgi:hypothetical protein